MAEIILFNKPFNVLSQFTDGENRKTLANFVTAPGFRAAGRLDYDSEGLLLLTDDGQLQNRIASPRHKLPKTYWVQVEGIPTTAQLARLCQGVELNDGITLPASARVLDQVEIWQRDPPIRHRVTVPTTWIELTIAEGRNRQVRRMTAAVGLPTLRLIRVSIGGWHLDSLLPGQFRRETVTMTPGRTAGNSHAPRPDRAGSKPQRKRKAQSRAKPL